jgi:hypothetical protein
MPHPTPVQIAYGSATVISTTLLLLLIAPNASGIVLALGALLALALGVVVAVAARPRGGAAVPAPVAPAARPKAAYEAPAAAISPATLPPPAERPEVRV